MLMEQGQGHAPAQEQKQEQEHKQEQQQEQEEGGALQGVTFDGKRRVYKARIYYGGCDHFIGRYGTSLEAGLAYDQAARRINQQLGEVGHRAGRQRMRPINFPDKIPKDPKVTKRLGSIFSQPDQGSPRAHAALQLTAATSHSKMIMPKEPADPQSCTNRTSMEPEAAAAAAAAAPVSDVDWARLALHSSSNKRRRARSTPATPDSDVANMDCYSMGDTAGLADLPQVPAINWAIGQATDITAAVAGLSSLSKPSDFPMTSAPEAASSQQQQQQEKERESERSPSVVQHSLPLIAPAATAAADTTQQQQQLQVQDSNEASQVESLLLHTPLLQLDQDMATDPFVDCQEWDELLSYIIGNEQLDCDTQPLLPAGQGAGDIQQQQQQQGGIGVDRLEVKAAQAASTWEFPAVPEDHMKCAGELSLRSLQSSPASQQQQQEVRQQEHQRQQPPPPQPLANSGSLRPPQLLPMGTCYPGSSSCALPQASMLQPLLLHTSDAVAAAGRSSAAGLLSIGAADRGVGGMWVGPRQVERPRGVHSSNPAAALGVHSAPAYATNPRTAVSASAAAVGHPLLPTAQTAPGLWASVGAPRDILAVSNSCLLHLADLLLHLHQQQHDSCVIAAANDWLRAAWQMEAINRGLLHIGAGPAAVCAAIQAVKGSPRDPGACSILALHALDQLVKTCAGQQASLRLFSSYQPGLLFQVLVVLQQSMFGLQQLVTAAPSNSTIISCRQLLQAALAPGVSAANAAAVAVFNNFVSML